MTGQDSRLNLLERTCDRCAQRAADCTTIDDAYICGDCRAEIAAEEAEVEALRQQLQGAVDALRKAAMALREYGQHRPGCSGGIHGDTISCACGLSDAISCAGGR